MKRLIKVINKDTAEQLQKLGYRAMTEFIDDKEIYVFTESDELIRLLNDKKKFNKRHWFRDNLLRF